MIVFLKAVLMVAMFAFATSYYAVKTAHYAKEAITLMRNGPEK